MSSCAHGPEAPSAWVCRWAALIRPGGVLIYETFALGNERYGRPSNPAFLLRPAELLHSVEPLTVVAFEQGLVSVPKQAVIQRVCAVREGRGSVTLEAPAASAGDRAIAAGASSVTEPL